MNYSDEYYMGRCLDLAIKGKGSVSPNPLVGCVIVKNGKIIAEGYHKEFGGPHAEVNASKKCTDISGSTVYVNLEPCSYYGKTPPCTDLLIKSNVKRVICGTLDPNPKVNGKGFLTLKKAGIETKTGILKKECEKINERFFKYISTGYPFITLKIAQTLDSKISSGKNDKNGITSLESRKIVHQLRAEYDAILVGSNTIKKDNPELTIRHIKGRQPKRIVICSKLDIKPGSIILNDEFTDKTILITSTNAYKQKSGFVESLIKKEVRIYPFEMEKNGLLPLKQILLFLAKNKISSILVEGGQRIFTSFMINGLYDKIHIFISPKIFGHGLPAFDEKLFSKSLKSEFFDSSFEKAGPDILFSAGHPFNFRG
jgi:diaminohydroxyphosphoribosylaminopyrimidine deaminase / 5-amino-6-(5-phosphoribosylamino)uracil reductase